MSSLSTRTRACSPFHGLALVLTLVVGCQSASTTPTSGETHFLTLCDPSDSDPCGEDLTCACGTCTRPCNEQSACSSLPGAQCVSLTQLGGCSEVPTQGMCAVECLNDSECAGVSSRHRCLGGLCVEDADQFSPPPQAQLPIPDNQPDASAPSAAPVEAGSAEASVPADTAPPGDPPGDLSCTGGEVTANDVVVLGDSFFATTHEITGFLEALARTAGAISMGERYRDYSRLVNNSLAYLGEGLANQYDGAVDDGPARVVIMNGGGADALLGTCATPNSDCPVIAEAVTAAEDLLQRMSADGVSDVIYTFYPNPMSDATRAMVDALRPLIQSSCEDVAPLCHFVDLRPVFEGHYDDFIQDDGLNPTSAGASATADEIWNVMQKNCIAQ